MGREGDVARRSIKQPETDPVFELSYEDAQPGWRDEQRLCLPREVEMLCDESEREQLASTHFLC